jgi:hypothetical protein
MTRYAVAATIVALLGLWLAHHGQPGAINMFGGAAIVALFLWVLAIWEWFE